MPTRRSAKETLDHDFLELRHCLLNIAAGFDRIERGIGRAKLDSDPRMQQLIASVRAIADGRSDRTERVQMIFSDSYDASWREGPSDL